MNVLRSPAFARRALLRPKANTPPRKIVNIVEVGPRDGLQNEKGGIVPVGVKIELIDRLVRAGVRSVEAGSFVSPKWVPQMAGTPEVLKGIQQRPGVHYPVLVPNQRGLNDLLSLLSTSPTTPLTDEIAIFVSATDAFSRANLNCTVTESLERIAPVVSSALTRGLRVRGYVSVVVYCPYEGRVQARKVRDVAKSLWEMGCYEVSLGDTVGRARPHETREMLAEVEKGVPVRFLAFHDTYGTALSNIFTALDAGVRTFDASVGGLGGCPYSPGATGNVATEDVLYALQESGYHVAGSYSSPGISASANGTIDLEQIADIGWWISEKLGRESVSRVGRAIRARKEREREEKERGDKKAKL
ncbi:aldolase [Pholiota conissans]|uniref:hydroxymethylglutaryl-CoA lyase n=1 Tax=Pholiota conissans TaxID=109636 RepID=A0A9P6CV20_9AGAR|nr:aldolase [Pholiota conissans]